MLKKITGLPDIHFPEYDTKAMMCVEKFLPDFRPDILIYMGDALNLDYISHHELSNRRIMEGKRLKADYREINKMIKRHKKLAGNPRVIYMIGNHEDWVNDYINSNPNMESFGEVENNIEGIDEFIELNKTYKVGKLHYLHGVYTNQYHAKKHVDNYKRNIVYGHTHTVQVHTSISPIDRTDYHTAKSVGCLCNKNAKYMEKRPSSWVHAFHVAYVQRNGLFSDYIININQGQFIWNGKLYKA